MTPCASPLSAYLKLGLRAWNPRSPGLIEIVKFLSWSLVKLKPELEHKLLTGKWRNYKGWWGLSAMPLKVVLLALEAGYEDGGKPGDLEKERSPQSRLWLKPPASRKPDTNTISICCGGCQCEGIYF